MDQIQIVMLGQIANSYVPIVARKTTIQSCHSMKLMKFMNAQINFVLFLRGNVFCMIMITETDKI